MVNDFGIAIIDKSRKIISRNHVHYTFSILKTHYYIIYVIKYKLFQKINIYVLRVILFYLMFFSFSYFKFDISYKFNTDFVLLLT